VSRPELTQAKADFEKVRAIPHGEWDPIGCGVPKDEYDSYAWPVLGLLQSGAGREEVAKYLRWAADENMGCPVPEKHLNSVLDKLMVLNAGQKKTPPA
jgi:hypothetical protein